MALLLEKASAVIVVTVMIAMLVAIAVRPLGWHFARSPALISLLERLAQDVTQWLGVLLLSGIVLCESLVALLWVFFVKMRSCNRGERQLGWMERHLQGVLYFLRIWQEGDGTCEFRIVEAEDVFGNSCERIAHDAKVAARFILSEVHARLNAAIEHARLGLSTLKSDFLVSSPAGKIRWIRRRAIPVMGLTKTGTGICNFSTLPI